MVYKATYNWGAPSCGAITILKNHGVRQWGWDDIPYMKWKIIQMFETTNQSVFPCLFVQNCSNGFLDRFRFDMT